MGPRRRVAILISGRGTNMLSLIEAARAPDYPAEIALVASNRPSAPGLAAAKALGVATAAMDHKIHAGREDFERSLHRMLEIHRIDMICLAGFMRLLTPWFVKRWEGRALNIHPALLPLYKGLDTHARALADGVRIHGCTAHFVAPAMDSGAIIAQAAVPVQVSDTPETLAARVLAQEHVIYPLALRLAASGGARLEAGRVRFSGLRDDVGDRDALVSPPRALQDDF